MSVPSIDSSMQRRAVGLLLSSPSRFAAAIADMRAA